MSLLTSELQDFQYYINKCPLYLRNSQSFLEHFRQWYDLLVGDSKQSGIVGTADTILSLINIFDDDYVEKLANLENGGNDILVKIGQLFNVRPTFSVTYTHNSETITAAISLTTYEFLLLIRAQIIKNYWDGSYSEIREFYDKSNLPIFYKSEASGTVDVYWFNFNEESPSDNLKHMFFAGLLTVKSMGIDYSYSIQNLATLLLWDTDGRAWDEGEWAL